MGNYGTIALCGEWSLGWQRRPHCALEKVSYKTILYEKLLNIQVQKIFKSRETIKRRLSG